MPSDAVAAAAVGGVPGDPLPVRHVYCTGCAAAVRPMGCGGAIWALLSVVARNDRRSGGGRGAGAYRRLRTLATYRNLR